MGMVLIGLAGKAGVGKDTAADYLQAKFDFVRYALASPIKEAIKAMFGLTDRHFERDMKEVVIPWIGKSPRQLAQLLGTEYGRNLIGEDIWLRMAKQRIMAAADVGAPGLVITDVRFDNEADMIRNAGGRIIHVWRDFAKPVAAHLSEAGVKIDSRDYVLRNNGSISVLFCGIEQIIGSIAFINKFAKTNKAIPLCHDEPIAA